MNVALISAIFDGSDAPRPLPVGIDADAFLITDRRDEVEGWEVIGHPATTNPRLSARHVKCLPWQFVPGYDYYVWIDGSIELKDPGYPLWAVASHDIETIAAPPHPWRDCIYDEARAAEEWPKYAGAVAYAESLRGSHPEHWGLWATTSIVWHDTPLARTIGKSWWSACNISIADQVALPRVAKIHYSRPLTLPIDLLNNRWFTWHPHSS